MEKKLVSVSCILLLSLAFPITSVSATSVGKSCFKVGALAGTKKNPIVCKKVRKKLIWRKDLAPTTTTTIAPTTTITIAPTTTTTIAPTTTTTIAPTTTTTIAPTTTTTVAPTTTTTVAPTTTTTTTTTTIPLWTARTYSGSGTKVIDIELPSFQLATITMSHNGNRNFIIWSNTSNFGRLDLLANVIGDYSGTRIVKNGTARKLEITSDGDWNVVIDVAARAPEMTGTYSGSGDCVLRYNLGAAILRLTNSGESNFVIWSFLESGSYGDLLANEIGDADLTKIIRTGKYLEVRSQGSWSIARQ